MEMNYSNEEIVNGFITGNKVIVEYLYKIMRPIVTTYITLNSGNTKDADEILQVSMLKFYSRAKDKNKPLIIKNIDEYFMAIVKRSWIITQKSKKRNILYDNHFFSGLELTEPDTNDIEMLYKQVYDKFNLLPEGCRNILKLYYIEGYRLKEIAEKLHYSNERTVITQKQRCLNYLKMMLKNKL